MTKRKTKPTAPEVTDDPATIRQALDELGINRPYYACRVVGNRLEFSLYGGDVVTWPPTTADRSSPPSGRGRGKEK